MMVMMTMMMIRMMKAQNGHISANFEATTSRFFMLINLNDIYRMMIIMMKMKKTPNSHNFEAITS